MGLKFTYSYRKSHDKDSQHRPRKRRGSPLNYNARESRGTSRRLGERPDSKESLQQAKISQDAYDRKLNKDEKFRGQVAAAKHILMILAKAGIANKIRQEDGPMLRWYAERKAPEEFGRQRLEAESSWPPENMTIILPGSKPHPRIIPEGEVKAVAYS